MVSSKLPGGFKDTPLRANLRPRFRCNHAQETNNILLHNGSLKPVSHQPCGSRAPVHVDKFLDFVRQPHGVVYYTARLPYEKQGRKAAATNFRHVHFRCDLLAFSERCTAAARHTRLPQGCRKTRKVFVRLTL